MKPSGLKNFLNSVIFFFVLSFTAYSNSFAKGSPVSAVCRVVLQDWEILRADSITSASEWEPTSGLKTSAGKDHTKPLWISAMLPGWPGLHPALYFKRLRVPVTVFINGRKIYQTKNRPVAGNGILVRWDNLLVPLPDFHAGDRIMFKIPAGTGETGLNWTVLLVSSDQIFRDFFIRNVDDIVFSVLFFTAGLVILLIFFISRRIKLLLGIALYLLSLAVFIAGNNPFLQMLLRAPAVYYHLDYISLISATIGAFFAIEQIAGIRYKHILRTVRLTHLGFLVLCILLLNLTSVVFPQMIHYFLFLLTLNMIISTAIMIHSAKAGDYSAKILIAGMSVFFLFAVAEIIWFYRNAINDFFSYSVKVLHFGALFFVLSLLRIAVYNYTRTLRQKETAQLKELEAIRRENQVREQFGMKLIESQENERNRIALELHDSVGQKLLIIKNMLLSEIRRSTDKPVRTALERISGISGETIQDVRNITYNLRPRHLDQLGLTTAIETVIEQFEESSGLRFHVEIDNIDRMMPSDHEINYYRIIQESLNNIVKHSGASDAVIHIKKNDNRIYTEIRDNGAGAAEYDLSGYPQSGGLGIGGMLERARMIGAEMNIDFSGPGGPLIQLNYNLRHENN